MVLVLVGPGEPLREDGRRDIKAIAKLRIITTDTDICKGAKIEAAPSGSNKNGRISRAKAVQGLSAALRAKPVQPSSCRHRAQSFNAAIISVPGISVSLVEWKDDKRITLTCMKAQRWQ